MTDLGTLGGRTSGPEAINERGDVTGDSVTADGLSHAFLWTASGGMQDLGTLPGGGFSSARDINTRGEVIGISDRADGAIHAFLWTASGGMQDLGTLPGGTGSSASGMNERGQVTGSSFTADGFAARGGDGNVSLFDVAPATVSARTSRRRPTISC